MSEESGHFSEAGSAEIVVARNAKARDARLRQVMEIITRHLHAAVKEIEPTPEEWMEAIQFLTRTGQKCDEWRQEFILLSDVLGVSMLVDALNNRQPSGATESTVLGPFHVAGAPALPNGADIRLDGKGEPMVVHGRVVDRDGRPIAGATLDVWQANADGFYDVQQRGIQPDFNLRGVFRTDEEGRYWFRSAKPKFYAIPDDGPVGRLLRALGRHPYRPAHLHAIVAAEGFRTVVTHLFDPQDPYIATDAVFGVKTSLLARFEQVQDGERAAALGVTAPFWDVAQDFVLVRAAAAARTTEAPDIVVDAVRRAEMDPEHAPLDDLLSTQFPPGVLARDSER